MRIDGVGAGGSRYVADNEDAKRKRNATMTADEKHEKAEALAKEKAESDLDWEAGGRARSGAAPTKARGSAAGMIRKDIKDTAGESVVIMTLSQAAVPVEQKEQPESWLKRLLDGGRMLLNAIWTGGDPLEELEKTQQLQAQAQTFTGGVRESADGELLKSEEALKESDSLWSRFKLKVETATGFLAKRFGRENSFQAGSEDGGQPREQSMLEEPQGAGNGLPMEAYMEEAVEELREKEMHLLESYDRFGRRSKLGKEIEAPAARERKPGEGTEAPAARKNTEL